MVMIINAVLVGHIFGLISFNQFMVVMIYILAIKEEEII